jgi:DNA-binding beta-propeller fold protein YncE
MRHLLFTILITTAFAQTRSVPDPGVITTRQAITPAGTPTVFDGRVYGIAFGESASELWVSNASKLYRMDWKANRVIESVAMPGAPGLQSIRFDESAKRPLIAAAAKALHGPAKVGLFTPTGPIATGLGDYIAGAIAITDKIAAVPLTHDNQLAVVDLATHAAKKFPTGIAPFAAVLSHDSTVAYVSNWAGRVPQSGDTTAPTGLDPNADQVVVDARGVASTGTVTRIDLATGKSTTLSVGLHPTALAWDETAHRLYVANGNSDSISVIDTARVVVMKPIAIDPFSAKTAGIAPTALALSNDRKTLYAACGGINAIAVFDTQTGFLRGMIPTAWYPNHLALSADGKWLAVSALLGVGPGWRDAPNKKYVHADRGSVAVLPVPSDAQLSSYTTAVAANTRLQLAGTPEHAVSRATQAIPIPARSGDPSLIEHVVFIIKENRTYDQVFGDISKGNGDASLVMFGKNVTPNQHKLAEEFVLFDNFYATGGNSADGHQWLTQANETDYALWPGYAGRSYPFDGTDPIAYSKNGFLWDYALARGKSVRIYGEYSGVQREPASKRRAYLDRWRNGEDFANEWTTKAPIANINKIVAPHYPAYSTSIPDVIRARLFLADLKQMEESGSMPNLTLIQLPSNHTNGTDPNVSTPQAMVADNDYALGQIVEGLSKSRFWPKMAIFIIEDDAQNGVDHVDGHRTVALAVSPYIRRGQLDSTFYSTQSMVKTIELILGLPSMSIFDLIAEDVRFAFASDADPAPFTAVEPITSLFDQNPASTALKGEPRKAAIASSKMHFEIPDAAPTEKLNRILWHAVKGWNVPYPGANHAVFAPLSLDIDDDDRK